MSAWPAQIVAVVEREVGIENMRQRNPNATYNRSASARIALARGIAITIIRFETGLSTPQIGRIFGLGHDMVIWWSKKILARMAASPEFNATIERLILKSRQSAVSEIALEGTESVSEPPEPPAPVLPPPKSKQPVTREEFMEGVFEQWRMERREHEQVRD